MPYEYEHPRPAVTVDLVVFAVEGEGLKALFIRRGGPPFEGMWAIPGGFLDIDEPISVATIRELREETNLEAPRVVEPIGWFGDPGRDPRGRTISLAHAAFLDGPPPKVQGGDDASEAQWLDPITLTGLAFDHDQILGRALRWLAEEVSSGRLVSEGSEILEREMGRIARPGVSV